VIPSVKLLPYEDRLKQLNLWSLEDRRTSADLIEVFKIIHRLSSIEFSTLFEFSTYNRTMGHSLKVAKKRTRLDLRQHFFSERIINIWNNNNNNKPICNATDASVTDPEARNHFDIATLSALFVNTFKNHLELLHKDGSFTRLLQSV